MITKFLFMSAALCLNAPLFAQDAPIEKSGGSSSSSNSTGLHLGTPLGGKQMQLFNQPTVLVAPNSLSPFFVSVSNRFDERYSDKGNKESLLGLDVNLNINAYGLYYGITKDMTFTFSVPYVTKSQTHIESISNLRSSKEFGLAKSGITAGIAAGFVKGGLCTDMASCQKQIAQGMTFPTSNPAAGYSAGTPVSSYIDGVTEGYFTSSAVKEGDSGLGDISMTLNNQVYKSTDLALKTRIELAVPTGSFDVKDNQSATGSGKYTTALYGDVEYNLHKGILAIAEHGLVYDVTKSEADGVKSRYSGVGQRGGFYLALDGGTYFDSMKWFSVISGYHYQYMPSQTQESDLGLGNLAQSSSTSYSNSFRISGFNYGIPVFMDYTHSSPLSGKNDVAVNSSVFLLVVAYML